MVVVASDPAPVAAPAAPCSARPRRRRRPEPSSAQDARRRKVVASLNEPNVIPEDAQLLERRYYGVAEAFAPRNRWQDWLTARISTLMIRIDRVERVERKLRDWAAYRAFDFWEDDRTLAAAELAEKLNGRNPARALAQLRAIPAGLDWLAGRWQALRDLAPDAWTDAHREQAYRLLGGDERVDPATPGFAAAQIEEIEADRSRVEEADGILRGLVESDLSDAHVPGLAKLRREVRSWHRQMKWYADQFHVEHPDRWDDPMRRPAHEKVTPDGFREVDYNHFEGPRPLEPLTPPAPKPAPAPAAAERPSPAPKPAPAPEKAGNGETKPSTPRISFAAALRPATPTHRPIVRDDRGGPDSARRRPLG